MNGKQIRLVHRDSATSPQIAVDAANALLNVDGAAVILGAMSSSVTLAVAQGATNTRRHTADDFYSEVSCHLDPR